MATEASLHTHTSSHDSLASMQNGNQPAISVQTPRTSTGSSLSSNESSPNEEVDTATSYAPSTTYPVTNGIHSGLKRQRSEEEEDDKALPNGQYDYSPPKRTEQPHHMADRALHVLDTDPPPSYYANGNGPTTNGHWNHGQHSQPPSATDVHVNGVHEQPWDVTTPTNGHPYDPDQSGLPPRKRKRNFANRTKTGCMTCRKRKKKCDERRPHCNNCMRGGFPCEGYNTAKASGFYAPNGKTPVLLQSKSGQSDEKSLHHSQSHSPDDNKPYVTVLNGHTQQTPTPQHERPPNRFATAAASEPHTRPPYPGQAWPPQQGQPPYTKDSLPPATSDTTSPSVGAGPDMSRPPTQGHNQPVPQGPSYHLPPPPTTQQQPPPVTAPQYPPQQVLHQPAPATLPPTPVSYHPTSQPPQGDFRSYQPTPPAPLSDYPRPSSQNRMSTSSYEAKRGGSKSFFGEDVERSRMNRGAPYNRLDPTLVDDRKRCRRALARYHAACEVDSGMDDEQARRMLEKVVDPLRDESHNFRTMPSRRGTLSHKARIEPPFSCTYGYNLTLMDSVYIAENTTIDDSGKVEIGPRTTIGANVKIITSEPCKDLIDRKGSQGSWVAKDVFIGAGVVIGDNAIIYPDVRLENGVTVEPGAIVKESMPENALCKAPAAYRPTSQPPFASESAWK